MSIITITTNNQTLIDILLGACSSVADTQIKVKNETKKPVLRPDLRAIAEDLQNGNRSDVEVVSSVAEFRQSFDL
jgi:cytochrome c-type biogenesis protein CcmH/NrfG